MCYDQFDGWFCTMQGEQNNHKLVINTPDLPNLWVLKFHSIHDLTFLWLLSVVLKFSCRLWQFWQHYCQVWYMCQWFFTNSGQTGHQQEKLITPSGSQVLSPSIWYKELQNPMKNKTHYSFIRHILKTLVAILSHDAMCTAGLIYMCCGQNKGKLLHPHTHTPIGRALSQWDY